MPRAQSCSAPRRRQGSVLFLSVILSVVLLLALAAAAGTAVTLGKEARYQLGRTRALALAEGVTEAAQKRVLEAVSAFQPVSPSGTVTV